MGVTRLAEVHVDVHQARTDDPPARVDRSGVARCPRRDPPVDDGHVGGFIARKSRIDDPPTTNHDGLRSGGLKHLVEL